MQGIALPQLGNAERGGHRQHRLLQQGGGGQLFTQAAGQLRGITWLAPVLLRLHELDQYEDAALVKAKVAALFTGFIRDPDGTVAVIKAYIDRSGVERRA